MTDPLDALLEPLCSGDPVAAERVFAAYEPYLRQVVRRQLPGRLRAKFDSVDVVQSVWADVLHDFRRAGRRFPDAARLRAFLVTATRNRFIDRVRRHHTALEREEPLARLKPEQIPQPRQPRPSELAQANDLWERMLALCPPKYHELLALKRQGLSLGELAARTGLHGDSIRRILRNLARQLAFADEQPPGTLPHA